MFEWLNSFAHADESFVNVYLAILRYAVPILTIVLLVRAVRPLLTFRREPEIWAWLCLQNGKKIPITHWESVIGRSKRSDIVLTSPTVSRNHAVLIRYADGSWTVSDAGSKGGVYVNNKRIEICAVGPEDVINIGGVEMSLSPITRKQEIRLSQIRTSASMPRVSISNLLFLTAIQFFCCIGYLFNGSVDHLVSIFWGFMGIILCQWILLGFYLLIKKSSFEMETVAFFLCTVGMIALAAVKPSECIKQLVSVILGISLFLAIGWALRDLDRARKIRLYAGAAGILLLIITLVFGKEYHGAKNWLMIGGMSIQPSELSKVCFVFVGASTMDRIMNRRNLILFIVYTVTICGCLAVMNDFGTALIFFTAFLLIAYLRSGSVGTIALACTSVGVAGVFALRLAPHAMRRFTSWRHIWENPLTTGYQQTRALMCIASGGLFGIGVGNGRMKRIFAADSDVVFATVCEELGLLFAVIAVVCIIFMALFSMRAAAIGRSSFYTIGACTAAGILLLQTIFNVLGTVDVIPLTGVTFPFVSNGGSSMICAWGLLSFVKAADTRQNASFAVRQSKEGLPDNE